MLLIQKDYTAWRVGAVAKFVCCKKCGTEFAYTMMRHASGQGTSLYFLDNAGAEERAQRRAESKLQKALASEVEPVECPKCGCFQANMVREARRRYLKYMGPKYAAIALVVVVPIFFCGGVYINGVVAALPIVPWNSILYSAIGLAAAIVLMPFVRFYLSLFYDPNRDTAEQRLARGYGLGIPRADYERMLV